MVGKRRKRRMKVVRERRLVKGVPNIRSSFSRGKLKEFDVVGVNTDIKKVFAETPSQAKKRFLDPFSGVKNAEAKVKPIVLRSRKLTREEKSFFKSLFS